ncbi:MAG: NAD(P)-dependent oxidoreductase [Gemmatimonadetes bacterium]|nr:NAD(P)-dependent oxidoreductase [Gemmatimonadota bacterium]
MRIVLTGATGFVGRRLLASLPATSEVVCIVRDRSRLEGQANLAALEADLAGPRFTALLPERADAVIHLAQANVPFPSAANELFAVNAASTQWLAAYAREAGVSHFVYASSGAVYRASAEPLREDDPISPRDFYALTKCVSEQILWAYRECFDSCVLRIFTPYGRGQQNRMIPKILGAVEAGRPVVLVNGGQPRVNPIHIDDLVRVIVQSLSLSGSHVVNVAGPEVVSVADIARIGAEIFGKEPIFEQRSDGTAWNVVGDTTKLRELFRLGELIPPGRGIRQMVRHE